MTLQLVRIANDLPEGFEALRLSAEAEGHRHMNRLADDWATGAQRFDEAGEALLAGFSDGELVAIGGMTREPTCDGALRLRRLYVAPSARRQGIGRAIANALIQEGSANASRLTVNAGDADAAAFWEAQGFVRTAARAWSHTYVR